MEAAGVALLFGFFIALGIGCRLVAGQLNHARIRNYIESKGGTLLAIAWDPFGPGWFGEKSDAIYEIRFRDSEGNEHRAHCKTSMLSGVYVTEDKIVTRTRPSPPRTSGGEKPSLEEENRRLREEIRRLKEESGRTR